MLGAKSCPKTILKGWDNESEMTIPDRSAYARAKKHCGQLYKQSPCLKVFEKVSFQNYYAICGK